MVQLFIKINIAWFIHCMKTEVEEKRKVQGSVVQTKIERALFN